MTHIIVSFCPNCGAPIWIEEKSKQQQFPPPSIFTCACKPEKHFKLEASENPGGVRPKVLLKD